MKKRKKIERIGLDNERISQSLNDEVVIPAGFVPPRPTKIGSYGNKDGRVYKVLTNKAIMFCDTGEVVNERVN